MWPLNSIEFDTQLIKPKNISPPPTIEKLPFAVRCHLIFVSVANPTTLSIFSHFWVTLLMLPPLVDILGIVLMWPIEADGRSILIDCHFGGNLVTLLIKASGGQLASPGSRSLCALPVLQKKIKITKIVQLKPRFGTQNTLLLLNMSVSQSRFCLSKILLCTTTKKIKQKQHQ